MARREQDMVRLADDVEEKLQYGDEALMLRTGISMLGNLRAKMELVVDDEILGLGAGAALVPNPVVTKRIMEEVTGPNYQKVREALGADPHSGAFSSTDPFTIIVSPTFYGKLNREETLFVTCHEIMHRLLCDSFWLARAKHEGQIGGKPFDEATAQRALDARVNHGLMLINEHAVRTLKSRHPPCGLMPRDGYLNNKITWENTQDQAYLIEYACHPPTTSKRGHDQSWGRAVPWEDDNAPPGTDGFDAQAAAAQGAAAQAVQTAEGRGTLPLGMARGLLKMLQPPYDITKLIRNTVTSYLPGFHELNGFIDQRGQAQVYRQRHRLASEAAAPALAGHKLATKRYPVVDAAYVRRTCGPIVGIADTSGSMSTTDLRKAFAAGFDVMEKANPSAMYLVQVDAAVADMRQVEDASEFTRIECRGGGGTDMRVGLRAVAKAVAEGRMDEPVLVLVATDGDTPWPSQPIGFPVVAVLTRPDAESPPKWIEALRWR